MYRTPDRTRLGYEGSETNQGSKHGLVREGSVDIGSVRVCRKKHVDENAVRC